MTIWSAKVDMDLRIVGIVMLNKFGQTEEGKDLASVPPTVCTAPAHHHNQTGAAVSTTHENNYIFSVCQHYYCRSSARSLCLLVVGTSEVKI